MPLALPTSPGAAGASHENGGEGIHWPDLDEDISMEGIVAGRASGKSQHSLQRWLEARRTQ